MTRLEEVKEFAKNLEKEIERVERYMALEIVVKFIDVNNGNEEGLMFYNYENFGKWYADNYDVVEIIDVIQSEA